MTTKRTIKKETPTETLEHLAPVVSNSNVTIKKSNNGIRLALAVILAVGYFWYKTESWPVVAFVGLRPVFRFEISQNLIKTYGKEELDNKITENLIRDELNRMNVNVSDSELNAKVDEISKSLGEGVNLEELLKGRGMTMSQFKNQLSLQMRVEKGLSSKISVSDEEVKKYLTDNKGFITATGEAAQTQAKEAVRIGKLQEEIGKWIEDLKAKASIWKAPGF